MPVRRTVLACALAALLLPAALRADPALFNAPGGAALGGHDPVAYFTEGRAVPGDPEHALMWKGAEWHFSSAANREAFEADPFAYAPKYGGYCAYAMSRGYVAPGDPSAWHIEDRALYLNYNRDVRALWASEMAARIDNADAHWPDALRE